MGLIAVLSAERLRGGTRLEFVCGGRALRSFRTFRDAVAGCIRHVSVAPDELPAAIERLQAESKDQRKVVRDLQERLAGFEAAALAAAAEEVDGVRQVVQAVEGRDQNELKAMALAICGAPGFRVGAVLDDVPLRGGAGALEGRAGGLRERSLKALMAAFGGRGGGQAGPGAGRRPDRRPRRRSWRRPGPSSDASEVLAAGYWHRASGRNPLPALAFAGVRPTGCGLRPVQRAPRDHRLKPGAR